MSIRSDNSTSNSKFEASEFAPDSAFSSIFESAPEIAAGDRMFSDAAAEADADAEAEEVNACSASSSSSSSSIGKNSDVSEKSSDGECCGENEVQSTFKGALEMMDSLEQVLPMRRGISRFYNGKCKSFTSLQDASSSSSINDITKPENAYTRKRRNLLAFNHVWDKNRNPHRISKKLATSQSTLALAVAMSSSESIGNTSEDSNSSSNSKSPLRLLPPLHLQSRASRNNLPESSPWRSFSVADLRPCATASTTISELDNHEN